jgi:hypothetical protein
MLPLVSRFGVLIAACASFSLSSCSDPQNRQEVSGEVKLNGKPIEDGVIQFTPLDGQSTGDGAQIVKGKYLIPKGKGLSPGKYKVAIYAGNGMTGTGNASPDSPNAGQRQVRDLVPADFNERTTLVREIKAGVPNTFDFVIP